jgi:hypothetical protein
MCRHKLSANTMGEYRFRWFVLRMLHMHNEEQVRWENQRLQPQVVVGDGPGWRAG